VGLIFDGEMFAGIQIHPFVLAVDTDTLAVEVETIK